MPSKTPLKNWVSSCKAQGMEGLKQKAYSVQLKLDAVQFMLETGASYSETAAPFHLNNPSSDKAGIISTINGSKQLK